MTIRSRTGGAQLIPLRRQVGRCGVDTPPVCAGAQIRPNIRQRRSILPEADSSPARIRAWCGFQPATWAAFAPLHSAGCPPKRLQHLSRRHRHNIHPPRSTFRSRPADRWPASGCRVITVRGPFGASLARGWPESVITDRKLSTSRSTLSCPSTSTLIGVCGPFRAHTAQEGPVPVIC